MSELELKPITGMNSPLRPSSMSSWYDKIKLPPFSLLKVKASNLTVNSSLSHATRLTGLLGFEGNWANKIDTIPEVEVPSELDASK